MVEITDDATNIALDNELRVTEPSRRFHRLTQYASFIYC